MTEFQNDLLEWYHENRRDLPFRRSRDPYQIWISEIMAQQTRIQALLEHFEKFIQLFPDVKTLAEADEDEVLKAWQGLGYYSRARNLQKAARQCVEFYNSALPKTKQELLTLAGVGDYTAGAIASIAYNEKVSAVDGNVIRVFSRLFYITDSVSKASGKQKITNLVEQSLPEDVSSYNQALMELGALVCLPKNPKCDICPIQNYCIGYAKNDVSRLPIKDTKKARRIEHKKIYIPVSKDGKFIKLSKRDEKGLLAGLYGFEERKPVKIYKEVRLEDYTHVFSHVEWHMEGYLVYTDPDSSFISLEEAEKLAVPTAFQSFYQQALEIVCRESK